MSWSGSLSASSIPAFPDKKIHGEFDKKAPDIPVITFVKPGPAVIKHTPGDLVTLPYASAAMEAPCS